MRAHAAAAGRPVISTNLIQVTGVHYNTSKSITSPGSNLTMLPLNSPPINGFSPQVVFGISDEYDDSDYNFAAHNANGPGSAPDGTGQWLPIGSGPSYTTAIFDTGSASSLVTLDDWGNRFDFPGAGLYDGGNLEVTLSGAGSGTESAIVNNTGGLYATGFGNASTSLSGTHTVIGVAPGTLKGGYNISILSAESPPPDSLLPNIVGSTMVGQYQVNIRNTRQRSLTVDGNLLTTPQVDFSTTATSAKVPAGYTRLAVTAEPAGNFTTPPSYFPNIDGIFNGDPLHKDPEIPTQWGALMVSNVAGTQAANSNNPTGGSFSATKFLFDTGAQATVMSSDTAQALGYNLTGENPATPDFYVDVAGAGGENDQVPGFYVDHLSVAGITWNHVPILVLDVPDPSGANTFVPGILGMNLFTDRDILLNGSPANIGIGPQFREWNVTGSGNWTDVSNWNDAGVPNNVNSPAVFRGAISAAATVTLSSNITLGSMVFDSSNAYTITGAGRITLQNSPASSTILATPSDIWIGAGSHTIATAMTFANDVLVETDKSTSMLTISGDVTSPSSALTMSGPGVLQMKNIRTSGLTVSGGTVRVLQNGTSTGTSTVSALSINTTAGAKVDLKDNHLIVHGGTAGTISGSQYTGITGYIQSGRNGGTWSGSGIVTSMTAATTGHYTSLAVAQASDIRPATATATATWAGQTITGSDVLVMYTYGGDANLDGKINVDDYIRIDAGAAAHLSGWSNGDFNYDGKVNVDDYTQFIDSNITIQGAPFSAADGIGDGGGGLTAVPEPVSLATVALAWASFSVLRQRRRP